MRLRRGPLRSLFLIALVITPLLGACSHPVARKLEGRWLGHSVENFAEPEIAVATGWVRGTSFEFSGSSVTVTIPAEEPRSGRYKVSSAHGGEVRLAVMDKSGDKSSARFTLVDEHLLRWHVADDRSVLLRREQ